MSSPHITTGQSESPTAKNRVLLAAAALAAFTDLVHLFGGQVTVARPLLDSSLADEPRLVMFAVWHMATVAMAMTAFAFFLGALPRHAAASRYLVLFASVMWLAFGLCFVGVAATEGGNLITTLNQPMLALPVGFLGLWGYRREPNPTIALAGA